MLYTLNNSLELLGMVFTVSDVLTTSVGLNDFWFTTEKWLNLSSSKITFNIYKKSNYSNSSHYIISHAKFSIYRLNLESCDRILVLQA